MPYALYFILYSLYFLYSLSLSLLSLSSLFSLLLSFSLTEAVKGDRGKGGAEEVQKFVGYLERVVRLEGSPDLSVGLGYFTGYLCRKFHVREHKRNLINDVLSRDAEILRREIGRRRRSGGARREGGGRGGGAEGGGEDGVGGEEEQMITTTEEEEEEEEKEMEMKDKGAVVTTEGLEKQE
jgi:uncharacterized membrane protein YgcG